MNEIKILFILGVFLYTFNCYLEENFEGEIDLTTFHSTRNGYDIQELKKKVILRILKNYLF